MHDTPPRAAASCPMAVISIGYGYCLATMRCLFAKMTTLDATDQATRAAADASAVYATGAVFERALPLTLPLPGLGPIGLLGTPPEERDFMEKLTLKCSEFFVGACPKNV